MLLESELFGYKNLEERILIRHAIEKFSSVLGKHITGITDEAMNHLLAYSWPGNNLSRFL